MASTESKSNLQGLLHAVIVLLNEHAGGVLEQVEDIVVNILELLEQVVRASLDDLLRLGNSNSSEFNSRSFLNLGEIAVCLLGEECDTSTRLSSSGSSS